MLRGLQELDRDFRSLAEEYQARKAESEQLVSSWSYVSAPRFDLGLHYFNRHGWTPGRTVRQAPNTTNQGVAEGLDAQGRLVVERRFNAIAFYETFVQWSDSAVELAQFDYAVEKKPIYLHRIECLHGIPTTLHGAAKLGLRIEKYEWSNGKLKSVAVQHSPRKEDGSWDPPALHHTDELFYGSDGKVQRIEVVWPATSRTGETRSLTFERRRYGIYRKG